MLILFYTLLIFFVGLGNKALLSISGEYSVMTLMADLPLILLTYFGLIAIWARAKGRRYFSRRFWQGYFAALMLSVVLMPFFQPDLQSIVSQQGLTIAFVGYALMVLLMLPYYWGLYAYAFATDSIWQGSLQGQSACGQINCP